MHSKRTLKAHRVTSVVSVLIRAHRVRKFFSSVSPYHVEPMLTAVIALAFRDEYIESGFSSVLSLHLEYPKPIKVAFRRSLVVVQVLGSSFFWLESRWHRSFGHLIQSSKRVFHCPYGRCYRKEFRHWASIFLGYLDQTSRMPHSTFENWNYIQVGLIRGKSFIFLRNPQFPDQKSYFPLL